jgi:hypothetical protein
VAFVIRIAAERNGRSTTLTNEISLQHPGAESPPQPDLLGRSSLRMPAVKLGSVVVVAAAAAGILAGLVVGDDQPGFGTVRPAETAIPEAPAESRLANQLAALHWTLGVGSDQEEAWQRFSREMLALEQATRDYERRLAAGDRLDQTAEQTRHTLIFGAAMADIGEVLTTEQFATLQRVGEALANKVVCRGLARS